MFYCVACFNVKLTTKTYANEIEWSIGCKSPEGCLECESRQGYENEQTYTKKCCFPVDDKTEDFVISCKDTYGDGWHGGYLEINGKNYCDQFSTGLIHQQDLKNDFETQG